MPFTRRKLLTYLGIALVPLVVGCAVAAYSVWHDSFCYVQSSDARVFGTLYHIAAPATGSIVDLPLDVGDAVHQGQTVAMIDIASSLAIGSSPALPHLDRNVISPRDGTVAKRSVHAGERIAQGADILTLVDLNSLYVIADVDESKVAALRAGQSATVYIPGLDVTLPGEVSGLTPATEDLVTTVPAGAPGSVSSGQTPLVPVLVAIQYGHQPLYPGMSAEVTIQVH